MVVGHIAYILLRVLMSAIGFLVVMWAFGALHSGWALAALPAAVLMGLATAAPVFAYSASIGNDGLFAVLFRFAVIPMTLFAGVFFPVGSLPLANGRTVSYAAFIAPAMLASAAMNGAIAETTFNFFGKMKYMRLYDAVVATPVTPFEVAFGELLWGLMRGAVYSVAFLAVMTAMGLTGAGWAVAAFPATLLVGLAFGGLGMMLATYVRSWQDFDYVAVVQFGMFLFSGTFAPADTFPVGLRVVVEVTPLYHGVELVRALTTGLLSWSVLWHVGYLLALTAVGLTVAGRRTGKLLYK
jgi:lipooligosaccharide transport system permease protein